MRTHLIAAFTLATLTVVSGPAIAADVAAGRQAAQAKCGICHEADDWDGEDAASLQSLIKDIVAGKVKHKTISQLSASEVEDIAAYWGQGKK